MANLANLFQRPRPPLVAVDIGTTSMRLVELDRGAPGAPIVVQRVAHEPLEMGWVVDGQIARFGAVAQALTQLLQKSGTKASHVAMAIPNAGVITRVVSVPKNLPEAQMQDFIAMEANTFASSSLDEVAIDYYPLGTSDASSGDDEVLVVAARQERVIERQTLAEEVGLTPEVVDVDSFATRLALARVLGQIPQLPHTGAGRLAGNLPVALIKVSAHGASMQILLGDQVLYESERGLGGQLLSRIAQHYGVSIEDAQRQRKTQSLGADFDAAVLEPFAQALAEDVAWALQVFFKSSPYASLDRIVLTGSVAGAPALAAALQQRTGIVTAPLNPFEGMTLAPTVHARALQSTAAAYATACGLALRRFLP